MRPEAMQRLVDEHLTAEAAGDVDATVGMYTDDVQHDVVGFPTGPARGVEEVKGFYRSLTENIKTEAMEPTRTYFGDDFCVIEHRWSGTVPGEFLGIPGNGRKISFRLLHVWEFRDGGICRENVWMDGADIVAQLTAPVAAAT